MKTQGAEKRMPTGTKGSAEIRENTMTPKYLGVIFSCILVLKAYKHLGQGFPKEFL